jgi:hypothetical protein
VALFDIDLDGIRRCAAVRDAAVVDAVIDAAVIPLDPEVQIGIEGDSQGSVAVGPVAPRPDVAGSG